MEDGQVSFQDILQRKQLSLYVGREAYLSEFGENLALPSGDARYRFIYNVFGQGGLGKTSTLLQFRGLAGDLGWSTGWVEETETDPLLALERWASEIGSEDF